MNLEQLIHSAKSASRPRVLGTASELVGDLTVTAIFQRPTRPWLTPSVIFRLNGKRISRKNLEEILR